MNFTRLSEPVSYTHLRELADTTRVSYVRAWENRVKDEIGNIKVVHGNAKTMDAKLSRATKWIAIVFIVLTLAIDLLLLK